MNHPNVVTVFDIGSYQDRAFLVTEYVEGETLRERMRTKPTALGEVLAVAIQVAARWPQRNAVGIVHRDIKPENIVVRRDGLVKVLDFGLAKLLEARKGDGITDTGTVMGTRTICRRNKQGVKAWMGEATFSVWQRWFTK